MLFGPQGDGSQGFIGGGAVTVVMVIYCLIIFLFNNITLTCIFIRIFIRRQLPLYFRMVLAFKNNIIFDAY